VTETDLIRFVNAQAEVHSQVIEELTNGCKRTHWMWFIFPQLTGLGHSAIAQRYAVRDLDHARRYLADPILGSRLRYDVRLMMQHQRPVEDSRAEGVQSRDMSANPQLMNFARSLIRSFSLERCAAHITHEGNLTTLLIDAHGSPGRPSSRPVVS